MNVWHLKVRKKTRRFMHLMLFLLHSFYMLKMFSRVSSVASEVC